MILPKKLEKGDTVAIVSLAKGVAGDENIIWRTLKGIDILQNKFKLNVKIMPNTLAGSKYIYNHPEERAKDLHNALLDNEIKAIINCVGGSDSLRVIPYLDLHIITNNPKIFIGYSDVTSIHMLFNQANVTSYYGPALLTDFAENIKMDDYTVEQIYNILFENHRITDVPNSKYIRDNSIDWLKENEFTQRDYIYKGDYEVINGSGKAKGHLIGGCLETLNNLRGTNLFPDVNKFANSILFLENSGSLGNPLIIEQNIRTLGYMGILNKVNGIIIGSPPQLENYELIKKIWQKTIKEWDIGDTPIMFNASFGHNEPKCILPYGIEAELNTSNNTFKILGACVS
ncbi:S66 family peptidase [Staphylococcus xylosus]|uniref:S66 family peptidase n=1 Tax=Staphylococcus xylosus TaxID=1288 RepID=UPI002DBA9B57|nr:S66 peptidase family protein [Staphylococcus xylosus]MEB8102205.1 LD-carboxypeptidase [Staphylococcus xylosus]